MATKRIRATTTRNPRITACRHHEDGFVHVELRNYEVVRTADRVSRRDIDLYLHDDGFASGTKSFYDGDGRCVRSMRLGEEEVRAIASAYDCWYYASVA